jgi:hypothetical protein
MAAPQYAGVLTLAVTGHPGGYADTFVGQPGPASAAEHTGAVGLVGLTVALLHGAPAGAVAELWLLNPTPGVDPITSGSYTYGQPLLTAAGSVTVPLASYPGVLLRVKSGTAAGTATIWYSADA